MNAAVSGQFAHLLLTRFNIPLASGAAPSTCLDGDWLEERTALFERYCAPSISAQRDPDFTWVLLIHERTPAAVRARLRRTTPAMQAETPRGHVVRTIRRLLEECGIDTPYLMTSRLDSDDALHVEYTERVHAAFHGQQLECVDIPWGYTYDPRTRVVRKRFNDKNPFITLIERCDGPRRTVFASSSPRIDSVAPVRTLDDAPGWLQVVHGGNISNTMRGRRVEGDVAELLRTQFAITEKTDETPCNADP